MPLLSELSDILDPELEASQNEEQVGEHFRSPITVDEEVGRRTLQKVQPEVVGPSVGQFFSNLGENVGEFATGMFTAATYPLRHPVNTAEALVHPLETAKFLGGAMAENYKQAYTPQPNESIPGMILRRLYEKPFDTLMDASMVAQVASGGAGLAARAATAGVRGAAEGAEAAAAIGRTFGHVPTIEESLAKAASPAEQAGFQTLLETSQKAARANRAIDLFDALGERAKLMDPLSIAGTIGTAALKTAAPDVLAALRATSQITDRIADRTAILKAGEAQFQQQAEEVLSGLNPAERMVFHPYVAGRVNFTRPIGEQLMTHTGEWAPIKGDVIRPDALEQARQAYIPIQQKLEELRGTLPEQAAERAGQKAMNDAREFLGPQHFDPLHPAVQEFVTDSVNEELRLNDAYRKNRETGEMRTSLDIAKDKAYRQRVEDAIIQNEYATIKDAEAGIPRPERTTVQEALEAMGPQGGIYFPHSAEAFTRDQSTIKNILLKHGEASPFKENKYALYAHGFLEHQDPVKALMRSYGVYNKGKTWLQMSYEAAEQAVKDGTAQRMPRDWNHELDPDVLKGTHQPFHPGRMMTDELVEEEGQRALIRLMEGIENDLPGPPTPARDLTIDMGKNPGTRESVGRFAEGGLPGAQPVGGVNFVDIMQGLVEGAEKGPMYVYKKEMPVYKIPTSMGHAIESLRESMQPATNPLVRLMDNVTQWWNWTNLNVKTSRLTNNIIGNTGFAAMQGVHPFNYRGSQALVAMGKALAFKAGLTKSEAAGKLARVFELPGIRSGGLQVGLEQATGTVGDLAQKAGLGRGVVGRTLTAPVRGVGNWAAFMAKANANIEAAYRGASLFYEMSPGIVERTKKMAGHMGEAMDLADKINSFADRGAEITMGTREYRDALRQVNRYFNNYDRTTPLERTMIRRIFPYYKFFKHSTELITRFPFEHPLKAQVARSMGAAALQDAKDTFEQYGLNWKRDVPAQLRDSLPIYRTEDPDTGKPIVWMYNTKGPNPFSQMNGYASEQVLQMLNPVIKVALERATGVNLFTRERYRGALSSFTGREVDPKTGAIVDSFNHPTYGEALLRSFWPYQTVRELVAQGRVPTDTASLIAMATNAPNAWEYDERGFPVRKPMAHPLQALERFFGPVPQPVQEPTQKQLTSRKQTVNEQLTTLYQRYPEKRDAIMKALESTAEDVALEYEQKGL